MKKFVAGLLVGLLISTTAVFGAGVIKSAQYNTNKVIFNGETLALNQPLISVVEEGSSNASNYMPVRAVLEGMGYTVNWDDTQKAVVVDSPKSSAVPESVTSNNNLQSTQQTSETWLKGEDIGIKYGLTMGPTKTGNGIRIEKNDILIIESPYENPPLCKLINGKLHFNEAEFLKLYHAAGF